MARQNAKTGSYDGNRWTTTQYNRCKADMDAGAGVIQIGQGSHVDSPDNPAPINPAGSNAGSADTPDVVNPQPDPPEVGGLDAHNTFDPFWMLKYNCNVLPFKNLFG